MKHFWTFLLLSLGFSLASCDFAKVGGDVTQNTAAIAASGETPATGTGQGGAAAPPPENLLAFAAGAQIIEKPADNDGLMMMIYDPINVLDELLKSDWATEAKGPAMLVIELPEQTEFTSFGFDSAGLNRDTKSPKSVKVEISDSSAKDGYTEILSTELKQAANGQDFPVTAKVPGRWVRLTLISNFDDDYYGLVEFRGYGKQLTQNAKLDNVSGTYRGYSGWGMVHLKQEGTRVTGCYEYLEGILTGGIEGRLMKVVMSENTSGDDKSRQLGLFSFFNGNKNILGFTRDENAEPGEPYSNWYAGEKLSDDIGDCPAIPDWKGAAAKSQLSKELGDNGRARLDGVNFDFNSANLRAESLSLLDQVAQMLVDNPSWKVTIEGHTDNIGGPAFNKDLSNKRAEAVKAFLVSKGVAADRLTTTGLSFDKPVASNDSQAGRAQNCRAGGGAAIVFSIRGFVLCRPVPMA